MTGRRPGASLTLRFVSSHVLVALAATATVYLVVRLTAPALFDQELRRGTRQSPGSGPGRGGGSGSGNAQLIHDQFLNALTNAVLIGALAGALIGRIGNGAPFGIGNQTSVPMPASGELYLGINDDQVADNTGGFVVDVKPQASVTRRRR